MFVRNAERSDGGGVARFVSPHSLGKKERCVILVALRIENWLHVERAFGRDVAQSALEALCRNLTELLRGDGEVVPGVAGVLELRLCHAHMFGSDQPARAINAWLAQMCREIPFVALPTKAGLIHFWVSGSWSLSDDFTLDGHGIPARWGRVSMNFHGEPAGDDESWATGYRSDMATISRALSMTGSSTAGLDGSQARLFWQSIRDGGNSGLVLYHEALLRFVDARGAAQSPVKELVTLERLGFVGLVDQQVILQVIAELQGAPEVWLGVNVSAISLCSLALWDAILAQLCDQPKVAARLFIEITETTAVPDMAVARQLVSRLRGLGCQIVLDDFGTGYASIRQAMALAPSVVKIDQFFLRRGLSGPNGRAMLTHLVGLAKSLTATLVVEGVETEQHSELAAELGIVWQQGWFWGQPSASRPWRVIASQCGIRPAINNLSVAFAAKDSAAINIGRLI